ncbi:hypothetical protein MAR_006318 [Mya arenaria]|uniref:Uncharacterized protein n=1 Tax=Mya arenaria TaxID=6604 RepID=A0ABY7D846_MYAAR|nr:hypothetical protein MAR_006318 [Mya arenaria]
MKAWKQDEYFKLAFHQGKNPPDLGDRKVLLCMSTSTQIPWNNIITSVSKTHLIT